MKVYIITFNGGTDGDTYGGGMAIVVANDANEALETMSNKFNYRDNDYDYDEFTGWYATKDSIEEHPELSTNLTEPQVIAFSFYRE